ncbi:H-type lectin domain-containing protein [Aliiroseovarius sp. YM-037]|uniref:H-type lectin domain-containing protein n=1 Tax=Aliiroseovarius sp. YM-037 TaxID=3341728 RepID=UPI003A7FD1C6
MKFLQNHLIGIDQGEHVLFSDFEDGGEMWTGKGPRASRKAVAFSKPFASPPTVQIGMTMWDTDRLTNMRADIQADDITETGFTIVFRTWGDSRVARIRASWLAIGELDHEDESWKLY